MTVERPDAVSFGETMAVFLATGGLPVRAANDFRLIAAGSESNVMAGLAMLGHSTRFAARVGDDALGQVVLQRIRGAGVAVRAVIDDRAPTGMLVRDYPPLVRVDVSYAREESAASRICWDDIRPLLDPVPRLLFLSGITPMLSAAAAEACGTALAHARDAGVRVVFDPNLRPKLMPLEEAAPRLRPFLTQADVVIGGADELTALTGSPDHRDAAKRLLADGAAIVVAKLGPDGVYGVDHHDECGLESLAHSVVDPVGAGDAFAAGFLSGLLRDRSLPDALLEASAVAACVVSTPGDMEGLPTSAERDALIAGRHRAREGVN